MASSFFATCTCVLTSRLARHDRSKIRCTHTVMIGSVVSGSPRPFRRQVLMDDTVWGRGTCHRRRRAGRWKGWGFGSDVVGCLSWIWCSQSDPAFAHMVVDRRCRRLRTTSQPIGVVKWQRPYSARTLPSDRYFSALAFPRPQLSAGPPSSGLAKSVKASLRLPIEKLQTKVVVAARRRHANHQRFCCLVLSPISPFRPLSPLWDSMQFLDYDSESKWSLLSNIRDPHAASNPSRAAAAAASAAGAASIPPQLPSLRIHAYANLRTPATGPASSHGRAGAADRQESLHFTGSSETLSRFDRRRRRILLAQQRTTDTDRRSGARRWVSAASNSIPVGPDAPLEEEEEDYGNPLLMVEPAPRRGAQDVRDSSEIDSAQTRMVLPYTAAYPPSPMAQGAPQTDSAVEATDSAWPATAPSDGLSDTMDPRPGYENSNSNMNNRNSNNNDNGHMNSESEEDAESIDSEESVYVNHDWVIFSQVPSFPSSHSSSSNLRSSHSSRAPDRSSAGDASRGAFRSVEVMVFYLLCMADLVLLLWFQMLGSAGVSSISATCSAGGDAADPTASSSISSSAEDSDSSRRSSSSSGDSEGSSFLQQLSSLSASALIFFSVALVSWMLGVWGTYRHSFRLMNIYLSLSFYVLAWSVFAAYLVCGWLQFAWFAVRTSAVVLSSASSTFTASFKDRLFVASSALATTGFTPVMAATNTAADAAAGPN